MIWHIGSCIGIFALAVLRLSVMTLFVVTTNQVARTFIQRGTPCILLMQDIGAAADQG